MNKDSGGEIIDILMDQFETGKARNDKERSKINKEIVNNIQ